MTFKYSDLFNMNREKDIMEYERKILLEHFYRMKEKGFFRYSIKDDFDIDSGKNLESSIKCRNKGNQLFMEKNHTSKSHEKIWMYYTASIAMAESKSEELAAGYANRSALLMHLRKYDDCLRDIERALKITELNSLKVKLFCRKAKCSVMLKDGKQRNCFEKAKFWLNKIKETTAGRKNLIDLLKKTEEIMTDDIPCHKEKEKKCNEIKCTNDAVEIYYGEKYGRHLIAKHDLKPGQLVLVEKFYVASMNTKKPYAYCSHCLAISWSTVPCDQCPYNMYCNEKCKEEAWKKYHDIECQADIFFYSFDSYYTQLSVKSLIMGIREAGSIENLKNMINNIDYTDNKTKGFSNGTFLSDSFKSLYSLSYSKRKLENECGALKTTLDALRSLVEKTNILGKDFDWQNGDYLIKNENALFIGTLLLRLHRTFVLNAFSVSNVYFGCKKKQDPRICTLKRCCGRGMSFSPLSSLINHDCNNNVGKCFTNNGKVVYFALYPIKKGSQIFSSYYCNYATICKSRRQKLLHDVYEFDCDCVPCRKDWPVMREMKHYIGNVGKKSRQYVLGNACIMKYERLINAVRSKFYQSDEEALHELAKDIEILVKHMSNPSFYIFMLILTLCRMLERLHGTTLYIPKRCKYSAI